MKLELRRCLVHPLKTNVSWDEFSCLATRLILLALITATAVLVIETDMAVFSLHAVKNITTAEGGAICFNMREPFDNDELYKEMRLCSLNTRRKMPLLNQKLEAGDMI